MLSTTSGYEDSWWGEAVSRHSSPVGRRKQLHNALAARVRVLERQVQLVCVGKATVYSLVDDDSSSSEKASLSPGFPQMELMELQDAPATCLAESLSLDDGGDDGGHSLCDVLDVASPAEEPHAA